MPQVVIFASGSADIIKNQSRKSKTGLIFIDSKTADRLYLTSIFPLTRKIPREKNRLQNEK